MAVKGPVSPLSGGSEPLEQLDSKDLQKDVKSGQLASELAALADAAASAAANRPSQIQSATLKGLQAIAANADFSTEKKTEDVIRKLASFIIKLRIQEKFREQEKLVEMSEELSNFVVKDPFLKKKLKDILEWLKEK